jgi:hypothetical protein
MNPRFVILLAALLVAGCVTLPPAGKLAQNRLYAVAEEAPAGSAAVMYIDASKISSMTQGGGNTPAVVSILSMGAVSLRMITISPSNEPEVAIVETLPGGSALAAELFKSVSGQEGAAQAKESYGGRELTVSGATALFTEGNNIYFGKPDAIKKVIDVKNGAPNAVSELEPVLSRLPDGDLMVAGRGDKPLLSGVSSKFEGDKLRNTLVELYASAADAEAAAKAWPSAEGMTVESVSADGAVVTIKTTTDASKGAWQTAPAGKGAAPPMEEVAEKGKAVLSVDIPLWVGEGNDFTHWSFSIDGKEVTAKMPRSAMGEEITVPAEGLSAGDHLIALAVYYPNGWTATRFWALNIPLGKLAEETGATKIDEVSVLLSPAEKGAASVEPVNVVVPGPSIMLTTMKKDCRIHIESVTGIVDVRLPNSTEWLNTSADNEEKKPGMLGKCSDIEAGTEIQTGYDAEIVLSLICNGEIVDKVTLKGLVRTVVSQDLFDKDVIETDSKIDPGTVNVDVRKGELKTDLKIATPNLTHGISG